MSSRFTFCLLAVLGVDLLRQLLKRPLARIYIDRLLLARSEDLRELVRQQTIQDEIRIGYCEGTSLPATMLICSVPKAHTYSKPAQTTLPRFPDPL
jgi:hypothetical protein